MKDKLLALYEDLDRYKEKLRNALVVNGILERNDDRNVELEKMYEDVKLPTYATGGSGAMDIYAYIRDENDIPGTITLFPNAITLIPTGLKIACPLNYVVSIRPRSGASINGLMIANSPGTIDSDYRGEVKIICKNISDTPYKITDGDRIAQMILEKSYRIKFKVVKSLSETKRGSGGFGHTGK